MNSPPSTTCAAAPTTGARRRGRSYCARWTARSAIPSRRSRHERARDQRSGPRHHVRGERRAGFRGRASGDAAVFGAARRTQAHRHQGRLRRRRLRRLHGARRRRSRLRLPGAGGIHRRPLGADGRGARQRQAVGAAGVLPRAWRGAMRHLHAGPAGDGHRAARTQSATLRERGQGCAGRRALPLHRLSQDHRGGDGGVAARWRARQGAPGSRQGSRCIAGKARRRTEGDGRGKVRRRQLSRRRAVGARGALAPLPRALQLSAISTPSCAAIRES